MDAPSSPARPWRGRLVVLAGVLLVSLNLRVAVAVVSPVLDVVRRDIPLGATQAGLLGSVPVVAFAVFGALAPLLARRLGLEAALVVAMLLSAGGEVVRVTVGEAGGFLAWSVVALSGMGMGNVLLPPLIKRYFPDRLGAVTAAYSVGMAVSTAVPPLLAVPVAAASGWRVALGVWAVVGLVSVLPWLAVLARHRRARDAEALPPLTAHHDAGGRVWRSPLAWGMALTFFANTSNVYTVFAWLPQLLHDAGYGAAEAAGWLALFGLLGFPSALLVPPLTVRMRRPWALVVVFLGLFVLGYVGLMVSPGRGIAVWMIALGLAPGAFPLVMTLVNLRTRTPAVASRLSGFVQGTGYGLAAPLPLVVGALHEATGSWVPLFAVLLSCVAVLAVASWFACRPRMLEDTWGGGRGAVPPAPAGTDGGTGTSAPLDTLGR